MHLTTLNVVDEWRDKELIVSGSTTDRAILCSFILTAIADYVRLSVDSRPPQTFHYICSRFQRVRSHMGHRESRR